MKLRNSVTAVRGALEQRRIEKLAARLLEKQEHVAEGTVSHIYLHPERYNRRTRRLVGYRRPTGLLTEQHVGLTIQDDPTAIVPRFVRRHLAHLVVAKTRRQRKARARMTRQLIARGMFKA